MRERHEPQIIGIAEYVDFPDWRIRSLRAKVDTGARTSALHVENLRELSGSRVRFDVRLHRTDTTARVTVETKVSRRAFVRWSSGMAAERVFVRVRVRLGGSEQVLEVGLVDRGNMIYRMLLGRAALEARYLVDVSKRYALGGLPGAQPQPKFAR